MSDEAEPSISVREANLRALIHEISTPMRGHDENGACCIRASLTPTAEEQR